MRPLSFSGLFEVLQITPYRIVSCPVVLRSVNVTHLYTLSIFDDLSPFYSILHGAHTDPLQYRTLKLRHPNCHVHRTTCLYFPIRCHERNNQHE